MTTLAKWIEWEENLNMHGEYFGYMLYGLSENGIDRVMYVHLNY